MSEIEEVARKYIGVPFRHQGRTKDALDCAGLIILIAHDEGISDFDFTNYRMQPDSVVMRKYLNQNLDRIFTLEPGCILYMSFFKNPQHLAIYTSSNTIIHAASVFGGVVEHSFDKYWISKVKEIYKYRR